MGISAHILQQAIDLYLGIAYPGATAPAAALKRAEPIRGLQGDVEVPAAMLEVEAANSLPSFALRLGQPMYPNMKLVVEPAPGGAGQYLIRVDSHDRHLHAPAGSPDEVWLTAVRKSNKDLGEKIEGAWSTAGLPTFKDFLRRQLEARKAQPPKTS